MLKKCHHGSDRATIDSLGNTTTCMMTMASRSVASILQVCTLEKMLPVWAFVFDYCANDLVKVPMLRSRSVPTSKSISLPCW